MNRYVASAMLAVIGMASPACAVAAQTAPATKAPKTSRPKPDASETSASKKTETVKRLQPSQLVAQVPDLPPAFVEKLNTRGCTIPQFEESPAADAALSAPNNVIEGEFAKKGQKDWAALCSNGKTSTIVIYWSKPTSCPASLARLDDSHYLKPGKDKKSHYSRSIRSTGESELDDRPGLTGLKPLKHQGIDDLFVGKSSAFFYCDVGKWRIFPAKIASEEKVSQPKGVPKPGNDSPKN